MFVTLSMSFSLWKHIYSYWILLIFHCWQSIPYLAIAKDAKYWSAKPKLVKPHNKLKVTVHWLQSPIPNEADFDNDMFNFDDDMAAVFVFGKAKGMSHGKWHPLQ